MVKGSTDLVISFALLMPPQAEKSILYKLLALFDVDVRMRIENIHNRISNISLAGRNN